MNQNLHCQTRNEKQDEFTLSPIKLQNRAKPLSNSNDVHQFKMTNGHGEVADILIKKRQIHDANLEKKKKDVQSTVIQL